MKPSDIYWAGGKGSYDLSPHSLSSSPSLLYCTVMGRRKGVEYVKEESMLWKMLQFANEAHVEELFQRNVHILLP